jgi:predicted amidohydrolase
LSRVFPDFKIAMAQMLVKGGDIEKNIKHAIEMIIRASQKGCKIIVLPECLDSGWTHPSARKLARKIPGETSNKLCKAARDHKIMVVAGLTELYGKDIFNSAILIDEEGKILLKHRKINVLTIAQNLYCIGDMLSVAKTKLGIIGVSICADNFQDSLAIGHVLARMGAHFILSPSSWAVDAKHDNNKQPYGGEWEKAYKTLSSLYQIFIVSVSNVGWITDGPWKGRKVIGNSLAVGPLGQVLVKGHYGPDAESLITFNLQAEFRNVKGTGYSQYLKKRGYNGP